MRLRIAVKVGRKAIDGFPVRGTTWKRMWKRLKQTERRYLIWNLWWPSAYQIAVLEGKP